MVSVWPFFSGEFVTFLKLATLFSPIFFIKKKNTQWVNGASKLVLSRRLLCWTLYPRGECRSSRILFQYGNLDVSFCQLYCLFFRLFRRLFTFSAETIEGAPNSCHQCRLMIWLFCFQRGLTTPLSFFSVFPSQLSAWTPATSREQWSFKSVFCS